MVSALPGPLSPAQLKVTSGQLWGALGVKPLPLGAPGSPSVAGLSQLPTGRRALRYSFAPPLPSLLGASQMCFLALPLQALSMIKLLPHFYSKVMTSSPSPCAWRPDFPGAAREAP